MGVGLGAAALSACASAPGYLPINHQRFSRLPPGEVMRLIGVFLQDQNFALTAQDRATGVIEAQRSTPGRSGLTGLADCSQHPFWRTAQARITLAVHVQPAEDGARVSVQAGFDDVGRAKKGALPSYACTSTGVLEAAVLNVASGQPMQAAVIPR